MQLVLLALAAWAVVNIPASLALGKFFWAAERDEGTSLCGPDVSLPNGAAVQAERITSPMR